MQTENLANNSYKKFYVLLNTNQIKLYTYPNLLKENHLLRKFLFSMTISAAIVIKAWKNIAHITSSIIHMTYQLNIQSSALKNVNLSYLVDSIDKNNVYFYMTCLLPKYWKLLPESNIYWPCCCKTINNYYHSLFEISLTKKQKEICNETIDHGRVTET